MAIRKILQTGAALSLLSLAACAPEESTPTHQDTKPFIDPLTLSQNTCRGSTAPIGAEAIAANPAPFDYGAPFALPDPVIAHFHYPVSTASREAQRWFDTGMTHMANFNHDEAIAAFRKAQSLDPACAMCFWGEGLSFGSNINAPYEPARGALGLQAAKAALQLLEGANPREKALIEALATRYSAIAETTVIETAEAYADAMDKVARQFPNDKTILSLAAEANMDTQPWDYWQLDGQAPKGRTARTLALIETALNLDPDFAPAIHLYIHITESSRDPYRAEAYADQLSEHALGIGHLVHMPSHIYLRLGRWKKSIRANLDAIAADEAYIAEGQNADFYASVYYPHNVHFVVTSAQFAGDGQTAMRMADKLARLVEIDPSGPNPLAEHIAASKIFNDLLFASDEAVLGIARPAPAHLYMQVAWHYARGTVLARQGRVAEAEAEQAALYDLSEADGFDDYETLYAAPLAGVLDVADLTLAGRILAAKGDMTGAIDHLERAASAEAQLPYFEPTWWFYPTRQTLGLYLYQDGQYERAARSFHRTLIKAPNNAYALYGLAETYRAKGDKRAETYARSLFEDAWLGGDATPELSRL